MTNLQHAIISYLKIGGESVHCSVGYPGDIYYSNTTARGRPTTNGRLPPACRTSAALQIVNNCHQVLFMCTNISMWQRYEEFHCMLFNKCRSQFVYSMTLGSTSRVFQACITQSSVSRLPRPVRNRYAAYVQRLAAASVATAEEPGAGGARHSRASPRVVSLTSPRNLRTPHDQMFIVLHRLELFS